jgi:polyphosphate kinase
MTRNTERRMEVGVPILDPELKTMIVNYVKTYMADTVKGRRLNALGVYEKINPTEASLINAQSSLLDENFRKSINQLDFSANRRVDKP